MALINSESALKAAQALSDKISIVKSQLKQLQKEGANQLLVDDGDKEDLEKEVVQLATETDVLKKSAPEGFTEESNVQYFLAIAELEKTNTLLRQQENLTQENIKSLQQEVVVTQKLTGELIEINNALKEQKSNRDQIENNKNCPNAAPANTEAQQAADVENKIRSTRKVYKELKSFLADFLARIDHVEEGGNGGHLSSLLQELWSGFQAKTSSEDYLKMSYLVSCEAHKIKNPHLKKSKIYIFRLLMSSKNTSTCCSLTALSSSTPMIPTKLDWSTSPTKIPS
jgi:hypothetical protein